MLLDGATQGSADHRPAALLLGLRLLWRWRHWLRWTAWWWLEQCLQLLAPLLLLLLELPQLLLPVLLQQLLELGSFWPPPLLSFFSFLLRLLLPLLQLLLRLPLAFFLSSLPLLVTPQSYGCINHLHNMSIIIYSSIP